jgi:4a-hydroxytetrahydrobiopterin dehydratase
MEVKMKTELTKKKCLPCNEDEPPLKGEAIAKLQRELGDHWKVVDEHHLEKEYSFKDFKQALDFTNRVGAIAEQENHHPDIFLGWEK